MAKLCLKKPSRRQPAKRRYKIEKKIREHNRKKRKEAKKLASKPSRKLIHVPNICPFKEDILKDVEEYKKQKEIERQKAKELALAEKKQKKAQNLQELVDNAQNQQIGLGEPEPDLDKKDLIVKKGVNGQRTTYYREFQKVVASADVILEVVDARDPLGTRCPAVQQCVKEAGDGKRLVVVLNKADLVPRDILDKWLKYLRSSIPCIPFKSSTQVQKKKLGRRKMKSKEEVKSGSICVGAEGLTSLLANYCRNKGIKTSIRVGVVGLPNVGKSSLINSLKRSRACKVGALPGITRSLQEVQLDSKIKLLDSPGLAFASGSDPQAALKNAVLSTDSIEPAEMILTRANKDSLCELYLVAKFNTATEFLAALAKRYGKFKKGGVPDIQAAAKVLVDDWNRGKISYHTEPPEETTDYEVSSSIVTTDVAEFDLDSYDKQIFEQNQETMELSSESTEKPASGELVVTTKKRKPKKNKEEEKKKTDSLMQLQGNLKLNKINKLKFKKLKKQKARSVKATNQLADTLDNFTL